MVLYFKEALLSNRLQCNQINILTTLASDQMKNVASIGFAQIILSLETELLKLNLKLKTKGKWLITIMTIKR